MRSARGALPARARHAATRVGVWAARGAEREHRDASGTGEGHQREREQQHGAAVLARRAADGGAGVPQLGRRRLR